MFTSVFFLWNVDLCLEKNGKAWKQSQGRLAGYSLLTDNSSKKAGTAPTSRSLWTKATVIVKLL